MASPAERRRAARHQSGGEAVSTRARSTGRREPITVDAIVDTALGLVERDGYPALTMRRVAAALQTGPASLYAHVVNKEDLDDLLIGRICAEITLPQPDSQRWREQIIEVCSALRDRYLRYPGISQAALGIAPTSLDTMRLSEGMLAILLAGGIEPRTAAWATDALTLYVNGFCLEASSVTRSDDVQRRFEALPDDFPQTRRYAAEITSGTPQDRFRFTLDLLLDGLIR
jgi:AcrR family transcriptional regulator